MKELLVKSLGATSFVLKKHSPTILLVAGVAGVVGSTVLACKATLKAEETLDRHNEKMGKINQAWEKVSNEPEKAKDYTDQDMKKDKTVVYVQTTVDYILLYGPAFTLLTASIFCIFASHGIMRKRNIALTAACKTVQDAFSRYRARVIEEHGKEKDYIYSHDLREEEVIEMTVDENGKEIEVKKKKLVRDPLSGLSGYARVFSKETSTFWHPSNDYTYNLAFLECTQNRINNMYQAKGYMFLNEVYSELGLEPSKEGQIVGWLTGKGDGYIDFGLDYYNEFSKGKVDEIILDFNVVGPIFDDFEKLNRK